MSNKFMSQFEDEEGEEIIESSGGSEPTHNRSLYLYQAKISSGGNYTFLIKATDLLVAVEELIEHIITNQNRNVISIDSIEIKRLEFVGSVMQI